MIATHFHFYVSCYTVSNCYLNEFCMSGTQHGAAVPVHLLASIYKGKKFIHDERHEKNQISFLLAELCPLTKIDPIDCRLLSRSNSLVFAA